MSRRVRRPMPGRTSPERLPRRCRCGRRNAGRLRGRSARLCDRSGHGSATRGLSRVSWAKPAQSISRGTTDQHHLSRSDCDPPVSHREYSYPCGSHTLSAYADPIAPMDSHDRCPHSCAAPVSPLPLQDRLVHIPNVSAHYRTSRCFQRAEIDTACPPAGTVATGPIRPGYQVPPAPPISPRRRSGAVSSAPLG